MTLSSSLPPDVAVGSIDLGPERLLYTFVNSSTLAGRLAALGGSVFLLIIFLYFYDLAVNGNARQDEDVNEANLEYSDPYGYYHYDSTTRIKR